MTMLIALLFWGLTLTCCGFAAVYGGWAGRWIAGLYVAACLGTLAAFLRQTDWHHTHYATFTVDVVLLLGLVVVAIRSDRWFPVWFAGFHLVAVLSHLASIVAPGFAPKIYFLLQSFWSVPMLVVLALGVALDRGGGIFDDITLHRPGAEPRPSM